MKVVLFIWYPILIIDPVALAITNPALLQHGITSLMDAFTPMPGVEDLITTYVLQKICYLMWHTFTFYMYLLFVPKVWSLLLHFLLTVSFGNDQHLSAQCMVPQPLCWHLPCGTLEPGLSWYCPAWRYTEVLGGWGWVWLWGSQHNNHSSWGGWWGAAATVWPNRSCFSRSL